MNRLFAAIAAILLTACATGRDRAPRPVDLVISNVRIVDGTGSPPRTGSILVDDGRIAAILPNGRPLPAASRTVAGAGGTIIPGLWDMHVHLAEDRPHPEMLGDFVRFGVTSVRDAGGHIEMLRSWDRQSRDGERVGPMIHSVGATLNGPGDDSYHLEVGTPADAAEAVRSVLASGATQVKVHQRLSPESLKAVIEAANRRGRPVFGHVAFGVSPLEACRLGMTGFEHLSAVMAAFVRSREGAGLREAVEYLQGAESGPFYACIRSNDGYVDPTLITLRYLGRASDQRTATLAERQIDALRPVVLRLHEAGVTLVAGSDVGLDAASMPAGRSLIEELLLLRESGIDWPHVIRIATLNSANVMGVGSRRGSIEVGKAANLVLYPGDVFAEPELLFEPSQVWIDGRLVHGSTAPSFRNGARQELPARRP